MTDEKNESLNDVSSQKIKCPRCGKYESAEIIDALGQCGSCENAEDEARWSEFGNEYCCYER